MANEHRSDMTSAPCGFISRFTLGAGEVTFAVKDTIDIADHATQAGSPVRQNVPAAEAHARVVQQLLDNGYQLRGKTTLHELAFGVTGINSWSGTPVNPHYPALIPGGSSSGSATVVATGEVDFAIGTDTGGSLRMPAACCGVVGLKPTWGRNRPPAYAPNRRCRCQSQNRPRPRRPRWLNRSTIRRGSAPDSAG